MNIILTRPLNDTENLMQELFNLGHKIIHVPTLKITSANLDPIDIKNYNALVFTSSNAVKNLTVIGIKNNVNCFCVCLLVLVAPYELLGEKLPRNSVVPKAAATM